MADLFLLLVDSVILIWELTA